ncbi:hypothetical protein [Runella aurantiaca]|uniref:HTH cro/C1-type domain-containing protein n=1 Tax=Runella aurantiaca TaxID=2282308 RepID=A0A369I9V2_9BACT|nr:hypothetical protein [Runella aurantiaca]RDB06531.1 hypothetical protein DVG78_07240 [Runella aurantiaca]
MELVTQTTLQKIVNEYEERTALKFKPDERFYERIEINPKRFWQLVKGKKRPTYDEAVNLTKYFDLPLTDLF